MVTALERTYKARRGDKWEGETFRLIADAGASFWTTPVVSSQLRPTKNGPVVHTFVFTPVITSEAGNGVLTISIDLSPTNSAKLSPGTYVGDIEVSSTTCPKSTFITFILEIVNDVTRP
jgi:hypothetical protein